MTIQPAELHRLLDAPSTAHLATLLPDRAPYSVPLWVGVEGEHIAFLTSPGSRKARNVDRDPRVAISMTNRANPHEMAYVRGRVVERVEGEHAWDIIDRLSNKHLGMLYPSRENRVVYLVAVDHAGAMTFG
ncbi:MAG: pyridoxamine 5'-phosphate oxidase family protein [Jiangellaceae bacterium]